MYVANGCTEFSGPLMWNGVIDLRRLKILFEILHGLLIMSM